MDVTVYGHRDVGPQGNEIGNVVVSSEHTVFKPKACGGKVSASKTISIRLSSGEILNTVRCRKALALYEAIHSPRQHL